MEKEFNPKEQFKAGPESQQPKPPTIEELKEYHANKMKDMEEQLPYLRVTEEYNRLTIALYEQGVTLGTISTVNEKQQLVIPGPLGVDLFLRELQAKNDLAQYKVGLQNAIRDREEQDKLKADKQEETPKTEDIKE